jgi:hypothetical protein
LQDLYDDSEILYQNLASGDLGTDAHFISLNPDSTWNNDGAYINFANFNIFLV